MEITAAVRNNAAADQDLFTSPQVLVACVSRAQDLKMKIQMLNEQAQPQC